MIDKVFTIPSDLSFVDVLADYLISKGKDNGAFSLVDYHIILPTNRSLRALKEAFIRKSEGGALLLPRLMTVNSFHAVFDDLSRDDEDDLNIIPDFTRLFILSKLINGMGKYSESKSLSLASSLLEILDDFIDYNISYQDLETIVPDNYAVHWNEILEFLKIITLNWNDILKEQGFIDKKVFFNKKVLSILKAWQENPFDKPVIMAGLSFVSPITKTLFDEVVKLPNGCAIFHGLDNKISDADFDAISETHPQYSFKKLFIGSDISLKDVKNLVETKEGARLNLLKEALRPPSSVYKWKESDISNEALNNLYRIDCPDIDYEADIISLILRKTLEEEGKRAVVVTPNRNLARIIKSKMLKWDIFLDDSSGYPLTISKIGMFFDLISNYALNQNDHVALLELLKHPFTIAGFDFENSIKNTRKLERKYLRGLIKKLSIDEVIELIKEDDLKAWLNDVKQILSPFLDIFKKERFDFETVLKNHIKVAEKLASTLDTPLNLWRKNEGKVCADLMFKVLESAKMVGEINLKEYQEFIDLILSGETIRPLYGMHPRLDILSPIESRLQKSDVVVIAGLNDDNWVNSNGYNPWINQNMKKTLSLLSEDFEIGVSALDFLNQASNGKVYLTRSLKEGGALKNPSRWLLRLDAVMEIKGLKYNLLDEDFDCYVKSFYEVDEKITINAPKPTLPINFKPSELSLSDLKLLWHDAYAIYAKHGLKLKPLDDIEIEIGAREFGIVVHEVLSKSLNKTYNEILEIGTLALKEYGFDGGYWFQKFENYAKFFYEKVMEEKNLVDRSYCEVKGEAKLNDIKIKARADRIDVLNDKTLRLIDYKTSSKDLKKEALKGYEPQLVLEAMMAREGCFENVPPHNVSKIEYWQVDFENGGKIDDFEAVGRKKEPIDKDALIEDYRDRTIALLEYYKREDAIYLSKRTGEEIYSDYDHLARVEEWMISGDDNNE